MSGQLNIFDCYLVTGSIVNLLCYVKISESIFFCIIYVVCHKNLTKTYIKKMRHPFLEKNVSNVFPKFHILILIKWLLRNKCSKNKT